MSSVGPTGAGDHIPSQPYKFEGMKGEVPSNTLQTEILQAETLLQSGNHTGAVQEIDQILNQLGSGSLANAARIHLLAARSLINDGAAPSGIMTHLNTAYDLVGSSNSYQSQLQQIIINANPFNRFQTLQEMNKLMEDVSQSGGAPSMIRSILSKLSAARSQIQAGDFPETFLPNLNEAYNLLGNL